MTRIAQLFKKRAWLLNLRGDMAPPTARDSSEVARTLYRCCYPHTGNSRPILTQLQGNLKGAIGNPFERA